MPEPSRVLVIGTASLDTLRIAGVTEHTIGGAGLYTALAARCAGVEAGLLAPRPEPMPRALQAAAACLHWSGPPITPAELPRLDIEHHGDGKATLLAASWGAEAQLLPALLPNNPDIDVFRYVHIAALSSARRQLDFVEALLEQRGDAPYPLISVGTYARLAYAETTQVRQLLQRADVFFMNANEAGALFGDPARATTCAGALLFVTLGRQGALLIEGERTTHVPAHAIEERDPTGAGDTFCGATLAHLTRRATPLAAARRAVVLAAQTVHDMGPAALLSRSA